FYLDHPAPLLRKEFVLKRAPSTAGLWITAAGYYTVWINGEKIGKQQLAPAWTDYSKRIYYQRFDVADYLHKGQNVIGIELGNGWYNPLPLKMWGHLNLREHLTVGKPRVLASMIIDGGEKKFNRIISDGNWKCRPGPVTRNSIYLGEFHDYRNDPEGWLLAGYDDSDWNPVELMVAPEGQLMESDFPPIRKTAQLKPKNIWQNESGKWTIDFGQNMAGWIRYDGSVEPGDTIRFRFGERIWPDSTVNTMTAVCGQIKRKGVGGPGAPSVAEQIDVFIPSEKGQYFEPRYTFHGFRYVEMTRNPELDETGILKGDFTAFRVGSDIAKIGSVKSNLEWLNKIQTMVDWTFTSNIFSVPSDCPAREKFGYGGDMSVNAEAWLYNYDMKAIFVKFIRDWKDAIKEGKFVDTAPYVGVNYCGIAWESSFLILQDWLFRFYGDLELVRDWYSYNQQWIQKALDIHGMDLVRQGLSDHESLIPVPVELIGTATYYNSLRIMQKFASLVSDSQSEKEYQNYADQLQIIMRDSLWHQPVDDFENKQTWLATLLYNNILRESDQAEALNLLREDLLFRSNQLTTGIFGTPWLLEVLSRFGYVQQAFDMVSRTEFPGWRHMIENGATTLWETWEESDNVYSQNHPMFGVVSIWFHKWIGGIDPVDGGFSRMMLHPAPVIGLDEFSVSRIIAGKEIALSWTRSSSEIVFDLVVPENMEIIWVPQVIDPTMLESIMGPDGSLSTSDKPQIIFNDPGSFKITYKL
ncbi:MAG: family 78 glycoside hydrolase catalytic domain, partial [Bacteroidales bacterium]|nr:family 78 glycoside hydrolase catalytic domain [Bacteroidales bacterium]